MTDSANVWGSCIRVCFIILSPDENVTIKPAALVIVRVKSVLRFSCLTSFRSVLDKQI